MADRQIGNQPLTGKSLSGARFNADQSINAYPEKFSRGIFDNVNAQTIQFLPQDLGKGRKSCRLLWEIGKGFHYEDFDDEWTIDLSTMGIDYDAKTGGLVDGISFVNGGTYLVWGFLDAVGQFVGLGCTVKPFFTSTITGGTGGSSATFTLTSPLGFCFTVGSEIRAINGAEWNWGTVTAVTATTVVVDLDSLTYTNTNITNASNPTIELMEGFRPYKPTTTQDLAYPNYTLIGEIFTHPASGNILQAYRADDPFRPIPAGFLVNNDSSNFTNRSYFCAQFIPKWANNVSLFMQISGAVGDLISIYNPLLGYHQQYVQAGGVFNVASVDEFRLGSNTSFLATKANTSSCYIVLNGFTIFSGMRG